MNFWNWNSREESDDDKYTFADIYLLTQQLEDVPLSTKGFQHWCLEAEFPNQTLYLQADNEDGKLVPSITYHLSSSRPIVNRKYLGLIIISPNQLKAHVMNNQYNYQEYTVLFNNCQHWVKELCTKLGLSVDEVTVSQVIGGLGIAATFVFGLPGAAASLTGMLIMNKFSSAGSHNSSRHS